MALSEPAVDEINAIAEDKLLTIAELEILEHRKIKRAQHILENFR
jgi:hypothetical protein